MSNEASESDVLQVGKVIRPPLCDDVVETLVNELYGMTVTAYTELPSYVDRNYHVHVMPQHSNSHIKEQLSEHGYHLKVLNSNDSHSPVYIDAMHALSQHLYQSGIVCPQPLLNLDGYMTTLRKIPTSDAEHKDYIDDQFAVRLFTFLPGQTVQKVPYAPTLLFHTGQYAGRMDRILQDFHNSFYDAHSSISVWSLTNLPKLTEFIHAIENEKDRDIVIIVIDAFKSNVIPQFNKLNKGMIHGDFSDQNIIVNKCDANDSNPVHDIVGVIDLAHAAHSYLIFEISITICYMMIESDIIDPFDVGGYVLAGYTSVMPLNETEFDVLKECIAGRLCQSLAMGAYNYSMDPGNEYIFTTAPKGWPLLHRFWSAPKHDLYARWKKIIGDYNN